jgi:hypothetical protein
MPILTEGLVNTTTLGAQVSPHEGFTAYGTGIVAWIDSNTNTIRAQALADSSSTPRGPELVLQATAATDIGIVTLPGGKSFLAWQDAGNLKAQIFNADGSKDGGQISIFTASSSVTNPGLPSQHSSSDSLQDFELKVAANGNLLISYSRRQSGADNVGFGSATVSVHAVQLSSTGTLLSTMNAGTALTTSGTGTGSGPPSPPAVAALGNGKVAIAWQKFESNFSFGGGGGGPESLLIASFNSSGTALQATPVVIASGTTDSFGTTGDKTPAITVLPDGSIVVAWNHVESSFGASCIQYKILNSDLTTKLGTQQANSVLGGSYSTPSIASLPDGTFLIAWTNTTDTADIAARQFNANGTALGAQFTVNTITAGNQSAPEVTASSPYNFTVVCRIRAGQVASRSARRQQQLGNQDTNHSGPLGRRRPRDHRGHRQR